MAYILVRDFWICFKPGVPTGYSVTAIHIISWIRRVTLRETMESTGSIAESRTIQNSPTYNLRLAGNPFWVVMHIERHWAHLNMKQHTLNILSSNALSTPLVVPSPRGSERNGLRSPTRGLDFAHAVLPWMCYPCISKAFPRHFQGIELTKVGPRS